MTERQRFLSNRIERNSIEQQELMSQVDRGKLPFADAYSRLYELMENIRTDSRELQLGPQA